MIVDLSSLKEIGSSKSIKKQIILSEFKYHNQEIKTPYLFNLELNIYNTEDSYVLSGWFSGILILICSRCLEKFEQKIKLQLDEIILKDDLDNQKLELREILIQNIILSLPMKFLCSSDCKGLCSICGKNLNEGDCDCNTERIDPRLAKLKEFYNTVDNEK